MELRKLFQAGMLTLFGVVIALPVSAQFGDGTQTTAMGAGRMVRGTVTAATADHLTVKTEAGEVYDIVVTPNTTVRKGRDPMKFADIHTGDAVGAMGELDAPKKTVHALMLMVVDAEQVKKAREAMGKTMITGTVTAIDELKITIKQLQPPFSTLVEKTEAAPAKKPEVVPAKKPETAEKAVELAPKPVKKPKKHWDDEDDDVAAFVQLHKRTPAQNGQNS